MSEGDVLGNEGEGGGIDGEFSLRPAEPVVSGDGSADTAAATAAAAAAGVGDEFEDILPSTGELELEPEQQPGEDEFECILPSPPKASSAALAKELASDSVATSDALLVARSQSNARYAEKVKEKRRARGRTQGDFSRRADHDASVIQATHELSSHGSSATVLQHAKDETESARTDAATKKSAMDKRYADKVAQKRRARGLTEGGFSRNAHGRARQKRCCGFTFGQFLRLLPAILLPMADAASDWVVTVRYAVAQEYGFLAMSIGIQLCMGMILGWMLAEELEERAEHREEHLSAENAAAGSLPPCSPLWGALIGLSGMSPVVQTTVNRKDKSAHVPHPRAEIRERSFTSTVALMALPQSVLQTFIGVAYSRFDYSAASFDWLLVGSVAISVVGSGVNAVATESLFRTETLGLDSPLRVDSSRPYMLLTAICRTVQTIALVGWVSLLCCHVQYWAVFPGTVSLVYYVEMQKESDGDRKSVWPAVAWAFGFALLLGLLAAILFTSSPADNNYSNETLAPGPVDSVQHFDCRMRSTTHSVIYICSWLSVPLLVVSLAVDPQHGWKLWRELEKAWIVGSKEQRYLTADDFQSPWAYARYMHTVCHKGMRVRALRTVGSTVTGIGQIAKDDEGVITKVYRNTCVCDWRHQCYESGRQWINWQDVEVLTPYPTSQTDLLQGDLIVGSSISSMAASGVPGDVAGGNGVAARTDEDLHAHQLATGTALAFIRLKDQKHGNREWDPLSGQRYDASVHRAVTAIVSPAPPTKRNDNSNGDQAPIDRDSHEMQC